MKKSNILPFHLIKKRIVAFEHGAYKKLAEDTGLSRSSITRIMDMSMNSETARRCRDYAVNELNFKIIIKD